MCCVCYVSCQQPIRLAVEVGLTPASDLFVLCCVHSWNVLALKVSCRPRDSRSPSPDCIQLARSGCRGLLKTSNS